MVFNYLVRETIIHLVAFKSFMHSFRIDRKWTIFGKAEKHNSNNNDNNDNSESTAALKMISFKSQKLYSFMPFSKCLSTNSIWKHLAKNKYFNLL